MAARTRFFLPPSSTNSRVPEWLQFQSRKNLDEILCCFDD